MSLSVRDAGAADYEVFARLFPALKVPDPVLTAAEFEEQMLPNVAIAQNGAERVGYAYWRFYGETVHIVHVVVDAEARRRGAGRLLMEHVRRSAAAKGASRWYLNVKADNVPAIRLYERLGLSVEQSGWSMLADWSVLRGLEGATNVVKFEPSAEDASRFSRQHGLQPERLALVRARPGVVFVALRDSEEMCALAAFDPAFPGIYPIAVTRPEHAGPLFDALLPHAQHPHVNIFVEGNAALAEMLRRGGAKPNFEMLRMAAPLP